MTRAAQVTPAVSAIPKARAGPPSAPEPALLTFLIDEDNGGRYHWILVTDGGELLVRSAGFESYEQADHAARIVRRGASRASFEPGANLRSPTDSPARDDAVAARDRLDTERSSDESGSVRNEAAIR